MIMLVFVVLVVLALAGGGWGHSRYGAVSWSPVGIIFLIAIVLFLTGHLHFA
jgi:hypothetical protein